MSQLRDCRGHRPPLQGKVWYQSFRYRPLVRTGTASNHLGAPVCTHASPTSEPAHRLCKCASPRASVFVGSASLYLPVQAFRRSASLHLPRAGVFVGSASLYLRVQACSWSASLYLPRAGVSVGTASLYLPRASVFVGLPPASPPCRPARRSAGVHLPHASVYLGLPGVHLPHASVARRSASQQCARCRLARMPQSI